MTNSTAAVSPITVGLDVGDKRTHWCALDGEREVISRGSCATTDGHLGSSLKRFPGAHVVLEAGSQSPWMSRFLSGRGYRVQVADPRRVQLISKDPRKTDRRDAELLARMASAMPDLLGNVYHRGEQAQAHLAMIRSRDLLVRSRTMAVQHVRGLAKSFGMRLNSCSTRAFAAKVAAAELPEILRPAVMPLLDAITHLSKQIRALETELASIAEQHYPEVQLLQQVRGVGPLISMAFVLSIEDPTRFSSSRHVPAWLGLCPRVQSSGDSNPQLRISKAGDPHLRRLLVQGACYILGPFGLDCDLRRFGLALAARGGKLAKKKAAVAVARKLAILLHRLWVTGAVYDPLRNSNRRAAVAAG